jgi:hypothetical protein
MDGFIARGLQNPAKPQVTSRGFQEHLVKGIIEDDHAYSLGEKPGMKKVFAYLLPRGMSAPSHQTVRRDLDVLWEKLDERLNKELQVCDWIFIDAEVRRLIRKLCAPKNRHLVPIRSMKIRWNTTYAEVLRGIDLKPVRLSCFCLILLV